MLLHHLLLLGAASAAEPDPPASAAEPDPRTEAPPPPASAPTGADGATGAAPVAVVKTRASVSVTDLPEAVRSLPRDRLACEVRIHIDPAGVPTRTEPMACDPLLYPNTHDIAMRYRFEPLPPGADPAGFSFELCVAYGGPAGGPTDIRTRAASDLAREDRAGGFEPTDPARVRVAAEAPRRLRRVPTGALDHPPPGRVCRLRVRVNSSGTVAETEVVRCAADLRRSAGALVEAWRFEPVLRDGAPVAVSFDALVSYVNAPANVRFVAGEQAVAAPDPAPAALDAPPPIR